MKTLIRFLLLSSLILLLSGCVHVISKDLRIKADPSVTSTQVRQNPDAVKGKLVIWGGEIIETIVQKDGTSQIEIFQLPLNRLEEPQKTAGSEGRFFAVSDKYLDPYIFRQGKRITVAGEITGTRTKKIGEMEYHYPILASKQIVLFTDVYYQPHPYYYDPWFGYPFGWGFSAGVSSRHHHH